MNQPWVYMCSPSWTPVPPPSPSHPSGSSQCTSPERPVSRIEPGVAIHFTYGNIHVSMLFSQIIPVSPSSRVQKTVLYICVSFAVSETDFKETRVSSRTHGKEVSQAQDELEYALQDSISVCVCVCCLSLCLCVFLPAPSLSSSLLLILPSLHICPDEYLPVYKHLDPAPSFNTLSLCGQAG